MQTTGGGVFIRFNITRYDFPILTQGQVNAISMDHGPHMQSSSIAD